MTECVSLYSYMTTVPILPVYTSSLIKLYPDNKVSSFCHVQEKAHHSIIEHLNKLASLFLFPAQDSVFSEIADH